MYIHLICSAKEPYFPCAVAYNIPPSQSSTISGRCNYAHLLTALCDLLGNYTFSGLLLLSELYSDYAKFRNPHNGF